MPKRLKPQAREKVEEQIQGLKLLPAADLVEILHEKLGISIEASRQAVYGGKEHVFQGTFRVRPDPIEELATETNVPSGDIARILDIAGEAFDDADKALRWLQEPNIQTGNRPPVTLIGTPEGYATVESILRQIQYGVYG